MLAFSLITLFIAHYHVLCNAQSEELIFSSDFSSSDDWYTTNSLGWNPVWLTGSDPYCQELGDSSNYCVLLRAGSTIWYRISLAGYSSIRIVLYVHRCPFFRSFRTEYVQKHVCMHCAHRDSRESGLDSGETCDMFYRGTSTGSNWIWTQIADSTGGLQFDLEYTLSSAFDNDAYFELEFGNGGNSGNDYCFMDNLRIYGVPSITCSSYAACSGSACVFPWQYDGVTYSGCMNVDNFNMYWCSYDSVYQSGQLRWENCCCVTDSPSPSPTLSPVDTSTSSPSKVPSRSPVRSPTQLPSNRPSESPSNVPTAPPSLSPSNRPTVSPSNRPTAPPSPSPSNPPTPYGYIAPTGIPTASTSMPSASPSQFPSQQPTELPSIETTMILTSTTQSEPTSQTDSLPTTSPSVAPSEIQTTAELPTVPPSRLCCGCLTASSRTSAVKGCTQDRTCEDWVCYTDSYCCDSDWDEGCVDKATKFAADDCVNADSATSTDQNSQQLLLYAVLCLIIMFCCCILGG